MSRKTMCVVAIGFAVSASTIVYASDSKTYNGALCRALASSGGPTMYTTKGEIQNGRTTLGFEAVCPIVRDNTVTTSGWDSMIIGVFDRHLSEDITCTAFSMTSDGSEVVFSEPVTSNFTPDGHWDPLQLDGVGALSEVDGYYFVRCSVPGRGPITQDPSGIAYYRVQEP